VSIVFRTGFDRRGFLAGAGALFVSALCVDSVAQEVTKEISDLKPGEYTWHPERQTVGPVAVVVSLSQQLVHVYRNGVRIALSTCSTGKEGHHTPTGVFVVLEKDRNHHSSTYNDAPMPNMNRLTWSGVALHAGNLPGYPASHGCVRLPLDFSAKLFTVTHLGTPVIIAGAHSDPWDLTHPGMILGSYAESEFRDVEASLDGKKHPSDWAESERAPIVSVVASTSDQKIIMIENGDVIAESNLTIVGKEPIGSHVFILHGKNDGSNGLRWVALSHAAEPNGATQSEEGVLQRLKADDRFVANVREKMHPGMTTILTSAPLHPDTRSGKDFVIMS
jgi:L,D-transpeptidase catalytic domain